jgi:hypothetical protein
MTFRIFPVSSFHQLLFSYYYDEQLGVPKKLLIAAPQSPN